jgi:small subunit ribosomal protein S21
MQVLVRDNNVDQALKVLKKKMQREGVFRVDTMRSPPKEESERRRKPSAVPASSRARNCSVRAYCR